MDADIELVEQARHGSQEAFTLLVERYQSRVFNLARTLAGRQHDPEDLAQEVFLKVYRGLATFRGDSSFKTWLYRVAINVVRSHTAQPSWWQRMRVAVRQGPSGEPSDPLDDVEAAVNVEMDTVRRDGIDKALATLSPELRVAVTLRDVQGLDYREIAEVLEVPIGTVMSRIARGRERLRPLLAPLVTGTRRATGMGEGGA